MVNEMMEMMKKGKEIAKEETGESFALVQKRRKKKQELKRKEGDEGGDNSLRFEYPLQSCTSAIVLVLYYPQPSHAWQYDARSS